jgi:hypothetical protein
LQRTRASVLVHRLLVTAGDDPRQGEAFRQPAGIPVPAGAGAGFSFVLIACR